MPYISKTTVGPNTKAEAIEAIGVIAVPNLESLVGIPIVGPAIHQKYARHTAKIAFTVIRKVILVSFVIPSNVENLLISLSKTQLQYSSKLKPDTPM